MAKLKTRREYRKRRHYRVRNKIFGTPERPRLMVYRSNQNIYASIIDDVNGKTLASASTISKEIKGQITGNASNMESAKLVGKAIAEKAKSKGIENVVFDRGGYLYHGRVKALADAAREGGLKF
jgi:large subunit ribosomal protein L18